MWQAKLTEVTGLFNYNLFNDALCISKHASRPTISNDRLISK
jgi:hypothetical protein